MISKIQGQLFSHKKRCLTILIAVIMLLSIGTTYAYHSDRIKADIFLTIAQWKGDPVIQHWEEGAATDFHAYKDRVTSVTFLDVFDTDADTYLNKTSDIWDVSHAQDETVMAYMVNNDVYICSNIGSTAQIIANPYSSFAFDGFSAMTAFNNPDNLDFSHAMTTESMFADCIGLTALDLNVWNTGSVASFTNMFAMENGMPQLIDLSISNWNTSNAQSMDGMFLGLNSISSIDVSAWNTEKLQTTAAMFKDASSLNGIDISNWDMRAVADNANMFDGCASLPSLTLPNTLCSFDARFAYNCTSLDEIIFLHDSNTNIEFPGAGSDAGAFYVPSYLETSFSFNGNTDAEAYDWVADHRALPRFTVTYDANSGFFDDNSGTNEVTYLADGSLIVVDGEYAYPTHANNAEYDLAVLFDGWYTDAACTDGNEFDLNDYTEDITVYAKWKNPPILAASSTWYTQGNPNNAGTAIERSNITSINLVDVYNSVGNTIIDQWDASTESTGADDDFGPITAYLEVDSGSSDSYKLIIAGNGYGKIIANKDSSHTFSEATNDNKKQFENATAIDGLSLLDTKHAITMEKMFSECRDVSDLDIDNWNTSNVISIKGMFAYCESLPTLNIKTKLRTDGDSTTKAWDISKVTSLSQTFYHCKLLKDIDISNWNTSNVATAQMAFQGCEALENLDLKTKVAMVGDTTYTAWDLSKNTSLYKTFYSCSALETLDISNWNTSKTTSIRETFTYCSSLPALDIKTKVVTVGENTYTAWDTSNNTSLYETFGTTGLESLDISNWDTSKVTSLERTFDYSRSLKNLDVETKTVSVGDSSYIAWDTSSNKTLMRTFAGCSSLVNLDIRNWNTDNVTTMKQMFELCHSLIELDINTRDVTVGSSSYTAWDTSNNCSLSETFGDCHDLKTINVSNWDTSNVTSFADVRSSYSDPSGAFSGCLSLTTLDLSNWDSSSAVSMYSLFANCRVLSTITLGPDFTFKGTDTTNLCTLPTPNDAYITGATGKWYNTTTWVKGTPTEVADNHAGLVTYTAYPPALDHITITTPPDKVEYEVGENFDPTGMAVDATFTHAEYPDFTHTLEDDEYTIPDGSNLTSGTEKITVSYTDTYYDESAAGTTKTVTQPITIRVSIPTLAAGSSWYTQGNPTDNGTSVTRNLITSINIVDTYDISGKTIIDQWDASTESEGATDDEGPVTAYMEADSSNSGYYKITIAGNGSGKIFANKNSSYAFGRTTYYTSSTGFGAVKSLTGLSLLDTSNTTNMSHMFYYLSALEELDVSTFVTDNVTNMAGLFYNCSKITELDVTNFNTSKVTDMSEMFRNVKSITKLDVSGFNTENVTTMQSMFYQLEKVTKLDVSEFNTAKVTSMASMFSDCNSLSVIDVSGFQTENVTTMASMFNSCDLITSLNVSNFVTNKVTTMGSMFSYCAKLENLDVSGFNTSKVTSMASMFEGCTALDSIDVSNFITDNVTNLQKMFHATNLKTLDCSNWNTTKVTKWNCFAHQSYITSIKINENFATSNLPVHGIYTGLFYHPDASSYLKLTFYGTPSDALLEYITASEFGSEEHRKYALVSSASAIQLDVDENGVATGYTETNDLLSSSHLKDTSNSKAQVKTNTEDSESDIPEESTVLDVSPPQQGVSNSVESSIEMPDQKTEYESNMVVEEDFVSSDTVQNSTLPEKSHPKEESSKDPILDDSAVDNTESATRDTSSFEYQP